MKHKHIHPSAKSLALGLVAAAALAASNSAQAALVFTLLETGSGVTLTGSGSFIFGRPLAHNVFGTGAILFPNSPGVIARVGPDVTGHDQAAGALTDGAASFGPGFASPPATTSSGDTFGFLAAVQDLHLPTGYTSGSPLNGQTFWSGETLANLGATPGTYQWNTSFGGVQDTITLNISAVPEPSSLALLGLAGLGLAGLGLLRRRR